MHIAEETIFPSTEWEIRHWRGHTNIDADVACRRLVPESPCRGPARCEKRGLIAIGTALQERHRFVHIVRMDQAQYGAKDFRIGKLARGRHPVENRWFYKISGLMFQDLGIPAVEKDLRSFLFTNSNQRFDA